MMDMFDLHVDVFSLGDEIDFPVWVTGYFMMKFHNRNDIGGLHEFRNAPRKIRSHICYLTDIWAD